MIRPLRRLHRRLIVVLALALPTLLAIVVGRRPDPVVAASLPTAASTLEGLPQLGVWSDLLPGLPIEVQLLGATGGPLLEVLATGDLAVAEPLVYVSATASTSGPLPADARLLGVLDDRGEVRGPLVDTGGVAAKTLWLYSLGSSEVVAAAALPAVAP